MKKTIPTEFHNGALRMKNAMLEAFRAHHRNIELGFPVELVMDKLREHMELITTEMVARERISENA